jgi:beta-galactosidase
MNPSVAVPLYNKYVGDWGGAATEYKFEAIKNGQVVKTLIKKPFSKLKLELIPDHTGLKAGATYDVAAVRVRATDEAGNVAHFFNEPVTFKAEGNIEVIGEETVGFKGGLCGVYVRTKEGTGTGTLTVSNRQTGTQTVQFTVDEDTVKEI